MRKIKQIIFYKEEECRPVLEGAVRPEVPGFVLYAVNFHVMIILSMLDWIKLKLRIEFFFINYA